MRGEVHDQLVAALAHGREQRVLLARLHREPLPLPRAVDAVDARDRRMAREHVARVLVDQRIDLQVRCAVAQRLEDRRAQQHVAMVAQLDHQRSAHGRQVDRVGDHGQTVPARRALRRRRSAR
jgi:hypothetical protein